MKKAINIILVLLPLLVVSCNSGSTAASTSGSFSCPDSALSARQKIKGASLSVSCPQNPSSPFDSTLQQTQCNLYNVLGIGANLGPHLDNDTTYDTNTLNAVYDSFINNDLILRAKLSFIYIRECR